MDFRPRRPEEGDLTGLWHAHPLSLELKRTGADADLDDSGWQAVEVPGHWGQVPSLADHDGPILYRTRFAHRRPGPGERLWLRFDGVLSGAEVWLDGAYIGDLTSYFAPQRFDVTELAARGEDHLLAVEVSCPDQGDNRNKSSLTGSLQTGPLAPDGNPGGIWRPVAIDSTGGVAIRHSRLLVTTADEERAELLIRLVLDAEAQTEIKIDTSVVGPDGSAAGGGGEHHDLASGENRIEWTVPIENPQLWWPAVLGDQPLYDVAVAVRLGDGELTDRRDWRTGLRTVSVDNFVWRVNGRRLFAKGIALGPAGRFLNSTPATALAEDIRTISEAGLDLVRIYGHIGRHELYEEADRLGLLVWQDMPLLGGYSSKVRSSVKAMAREAVDHLGHHPSIGLWSAHCEPSGQALPEPVLADEPGGARFARHFLPSWNRLILDPVIGRELRNADGSRPTVARSGSLPSPGDPTGSDAHLWLGWHAGRAEDLGRILKRWPRLAAFLGGIGTQSATVQDWDASAPAWASAERGAFARYLPRRAYASGRSWAEATLAYQADVLRTHIETLRRLKYRPAGGFCVMALADAEPGGGFGVLDYERRPKPAHNVLIDACRPVVVVADNPPTVVVPNESISLAVHVVSDLQEPLGPVRVTAHVHDGTDGGFSHTVAWDGELPADSCLKVGDLEVSAPASHGAMVIDLQLESSERLATNRYRTVVIPESESLDRPRR